MKKERRGRLEEKPCLLFFAASLIGFSTPETGEVWQAANLKAFSPRKLEIWKRTDDSHGILRPVPASINYKSLVKTF